MCVWTVGIARTMPIGSCADVREQIQSIWAELLAAILALLLAGRGGSPPPDRQDEPTRANEKGEDDRPPPRIVPSWGFLAPLRRGLSSP